MYLSLKILNVTKALALLLGLLSSPIWFIPLFTINFVARSLVWILAKIFRRDLDSFIHNEHTFFALRNSNYAVMNMLNTSLMKGPVTREQLISAFQQRVLSVKNPQSGKLLYEGLTKSWEGFLGYAFWKRDPQFDLNNHIRDYDYEWKLPSPLTREEYNQKVLPGLLNAPWIRSRSPWEILVIPNLSYEGESGNTVVVFRMDHILADGYNCIEMLKRLSQSPFPIPKFKFAARKFTAVEKIGLMLKMPWDLARNLSVLYGAPGILQGKKLSKEGDIVSVSPRINVEVIKEIKNHFGVNYAAVVYAAIFGGIERALKCSGQRELPERMAIGFVVPKRGPHPSVLSIHAMTLYAEWPMTSRSPAERLQRIQKDLKDLSHSSAAIAYPLIAKLLSFLPMWARRLATTMSLSNGLSIIISNFPVTTAPDYFQGSEYLEMSVALGTLPSLGMFLITGGVNNKQIFTFSVNQNVFSSEDAARGLGKFVEEEFQSLLEACV